MTQYLATVNTPGYSPMDDDPPVFDSAAEAWGWLRDELQRSEDDMPDDGHDCQAECPEEKHIYSETYYRLGHRASAAAYGSDMVGTVYGPTPGYSGEHDLGMAYNVDVYDEPTP